MTRSRLAGWWCALACGLSLGCGASPVPAPDAEDASTPRVRQYFGIPKVPRLEAPPVEVTPSAATEVTRAIAGMSTPHYLRLRCEPGGCTGILHKLDLDPEVTADDRTFESGGVRVVIAEKQVEMLRGSRIDFVHEGGQVGFKITNPKREADAAKLPPCPVPVDDEDGE